MRQTFTTEESNRATQVSLGSRVEEHGGSSSGALKRISRLTFSQYRLILIEKDQVISTETNDYITGGGNNEE
jgi:hypothetical protein